MSSITSVRAYPAIQQYMFLLTSPALLKKKKYQEGIKLNLIEERRSPSVCDYNKGKKKKNNNILCIYVLYVKKVGPFLGFTHYIRNKKHYLSINDQYMER